MTKRRSITGRGDGSLVRVERVAVELPVVMHVQDDDQSLRQQLVDHAVDSREERRVDRERRFGVRVVAPAYGQPHRLEARRRGLVDEVVGHGEAPRAFGWRLEHVAEVHAAAERGGGRRSAGGCTGRCVVRHRRVRADVGDGLRRGDGQWRWFRRRRPWPEESACAAPRARRSVEYPEDATRITSSSYRRARRVTAGDLNPAHEFRRPCPSRESNPLRRPSRRDPDPRPRE